MYYNLSFLESVPLFKSNPVGHHDEATENDVNERGGSEVSRGVPPIRENRVQKGKIGCFVSKKKVQFFNWTFWK